ncbi:MAG: uroporphyrinogen decarboxylase family protein [Anaerolineae bacterium]|nr:uroporphyrinogen decarboxylase family protein [Anaerolineae bacterium]
MNPRERLLTALDHREPDRVPFDLGSTQVTGIHMVAYRHLRQALGLPPVQARLCDHIQQLALPDEDVLERLGVDVRGLFPLNSHTPPPTPPLRDGKHVGVLEEDDEGWVYHDEWGITYRRPKPDGLYFTITQVPLGDPQLSVRDIERHAWPDMADPQRIAGLRELAERYRAAGYAVVLKSPFAGIFEMAQRIVGMENCLTMMAAEPKLAEALFDKLLELKLAFWEMALPRLADPSSGSGQAMIDVVAEFDDYGTQTSLLISPRMFRQLLKPRLKVLFERIRQLAPQAKRFFHSCGNVRPLLPDFIEVGVEILNPVHIRAAGMEPTALKRDFGDALVFWGGGVDTQDVLPHGTPQEVRDDVRRNIEALAPGGGFVFSAVHNIQPDVPPQNLIAMWEALQEYGAL